MNKGKDKANLKIDFEILHIGLCDAVICTRLPIDDAVKRCNAESPTGIGSRWSFDGKSVNQNPCPYGQGKIHYHLFC